MPKNTSDLNTLYLVVKRRLLVFQIVSNLAMAATGKVIVMRISVVQLPSSNKVAPRYLKLQTSYILSSFTDVCAVDHDFALFCADLHTISLCTLNQSVCIRL